MAEIRVCTKCGSDNINAWGDCVPCLRVRVARYHERHKEKVKRQRKERQATTIDGALYVWSHSTAQRLRKTTRRIVAFNDGKPRTKPGPGGSITAAQLRELWLQQDGMCALTGWPMVIRKGEPSLQSASVDRIDKTKRYDIDNLRLVTLQANAARLFGTDDDLYRFCEDVVAASEGHE